MNIASAQRIPAVGHSCRAVTHTHTFDTHQMIPAVGHSCRAVTHTHTSENSHCGTFLQSCDTHTHIREFPLWDIPAEL